MKIGWYASALKKKKYFEALKITFGMVTFDESKSTFTNKSTNKFLKVSHFWGKNPTF